MRLALAIGFFTVFLLGRLSVPRQLTSPDHSEANLESLAKQCPDLPTRAQPAPVNEVAVENKLDLHQHRVASSTTSPQERVSWIEAEKAGLQVSRQSEVGPFLEKVRLEILPTTLNSLRAVGKTDEVTRHLNSNFIGLLSPEPGISPFVINLLASFGNSNNSLKGYFSVLVSRNGRIFDKSSDNGELTSIKKLDDNSSAVFLTVGNFNLQLYYFPLLESFRGNCYERQKDGVNRFVGTVQLERVSVEKRS